VAHDNALQLEIFRGTRPIIPDGIPNRYEGLIRRCWDTDLNRRPRAVVISVYFSRIQQDGLDGLVLQNALARTGSEISTVTSGISSTALMSICDTGDSSGASCAIDFSIDITYKV
ncbi:26118_t:CDS:2, partial [Racocetra persica]